MKILFKKAVIVLIFTFATSGNELLSEQSENVPSRIILDEDFNISDALKQSWDENYEKVIEFIKQHEGFANGKPYRCISGQLTIGYGHVIREGEYFPSQISKETADSLLRQDFKRAIKTTERLTTLQGSRKLAIAHFIYSKGCGAFSRSTLLKEITLNGDIDKELMKWCYYTNPKTKTKHKSIVAENISKWECNMWHVDDQLYSFDRISR
ncbi:MAG: lysozyme [Bacteroidales bacterium]|nr:lysozyme [Bacteroidales bacterium]